MSSDVVICGFARSPFTPAKKGELAKVRPDDLAADLLAHGDEALLVGDGALRYSETFAGLRGVDAAEPNIAYPSADSIVQLAHAKALREEFVTPTELEPVYLRKPDAVEIENQKRKLS